MVHCSLFLYLISGFLIFYCIVWPKPLIMEQYLYWNSLYFQQFCTYSTLDCNVFLLFWNYYGVAAFPLRLYNASFKRRHYRVWKLSFRCKCLFYYCVFNVIPIEWSENLLLSYFVSSYFKMFLSFCSRTLIFSCPQLESMPKLPVWCDAYKISPTK